MSGSAEQQPPSEEKAVSTQRTAPHPVAQQKKKKIDDSAPKVMMTVVASTAVINGDYILMGKRRDTGLWTLPGGKAERNETKEKAALRELYEEAGIKPDKLHYLTTEKAIGYEGKKLVIHAFCCFGAYDTTTRYDPDKEVFRWVWIHASGGLPDEIKENLHSPKNTVLKAIGLLDY